MPKIIATLIRMALTIFLIVTMFNYLTILGLVTIVVLFHAVFDYLVRKQYLNLLYAIIKRRLGYADRT